ncbi:DinB family protein [Cohnella lubricantis]|uniref:DinB family protein n=1 Tax=Cohnella lubricantis TaxID=2163172 RepID=A0A841T6P8_9BACL|nr:DinB family protein [Cohnella lubricantis]MBB6675716.1 DinB family protein [Cohnella lubricantis]MBP2118860.1 hypothetical protein [Cohnella lubricantis]
MSAITRLETYLQEIPKLVTGFEQEAFLRKPAPNKWSKQEILGHLCDSAANNHIRFARILLSGEPVKIEGYQQDEWVQLHGYQHNYSCLELLALWIHLNKQILYVMRHASESDLNKSCVLSDGSQVSLRWLFDDYLDHMVHHREQIEG